MSSLSIPSDFADDVPELTNLDTSSVCVVAMCVSLVMLASVFGFSAFPVTDDIPVVYEIISSGFVVVPFTISAAVTQHHLDKYQNASLPLGTGFLIHTSERYLELAVHKLYEENEKRR